MDKERTVWGEGVPYVNQRIPFSCMQRPTFAGAKSFISKKVKMTDLECIHCGGRILYNTESNKWECDCTNNKKKGADKSE